MKLFVTSLFAMCALSSCSLVTTPLKIATKATTTTIGLAGKAAGAGIDLMRSDDSEGKPEEKTTDSIPADHS